MNFDWDEDKARRNLRKHRINFTEAMTVFDDPLALTIPDPRHSHGEERFVDVGYSTRGQLLVVSYTERQSTIRIISCRMATKVEQNTYEENYG